MTNKAKGAGNRAPANTASQTRGQSDGANRSLPDNIPAELRYMPTARLMAQSCEGWEATVAKVESGRSFQSQVQSAAALDAAPSPCQSHLTVMPVIQVDTDDPDCVPSILSGRDLIIAARSLELPKVPCLVCSREDAMRVLQELARRRERTRIKRDQDAEYFASLHDDAPAYLAR